jgi:hypothetical protein
MPLNTRVKRTWSTGKAQIAVRGGVAGHVGDALEDEMLLEPCVLQAGCSQLLDALGVQKHADVADVTSSH